MSNIINAIKNLPRRGQHNFTKILCLSLGLAVSSVIIAEIYFERTFDTYFPNWERTYEIYENISFNNTNNINAGLTSGGIAPLVKKYAPMVEAATRTHWASESAKCIFDNKMPLVRNIIMTDTCFFDVFPQKILAGNPKEVLARPGYCMIDSETAEALGGGNVVGKHFTLAENPGQTFTVGGVYERFPWGSSHRTYSIFVSNDSHKMFGLYDGSTNLVGNDCYMSFIRLAKGHKVEELKPYIKKMIQENFPIKSLKESGMEYDFDFHILSEVYTQDEYTKMMGWILSIVAFVLLFTSVMNYLLIIVGNLVNRSREMAVRKCYGAEPHNIRSIIFSEALVHVCLSVMLAAVLVFLCKGTIEEFLSAPVSALLFNRGSWILIVICLLVLLIGGLIPGWLYNKIPIATAFRGYNKNRNHWKLALLGIQFTISGMLFSMLYVVNGQYSQMTNLDLGYEYDNLAILTIDGIEHEERKQCLAELNRMPEVAQTSSVETIPLSTYGYSGDMISLPNDSRTLFNVFNRYGNNENYFNLMGMHFVEGGNFTELNDSSSQIIVDETFAEQICKIAHWKDGVVGKSICITGRPLRKYTICGVVNTIKSGNYGKTGEENLNPMVYFYSPKTCWYMHVKFHKLTEASMQAVIQKVQEMFPNKTVTLKNYTSQVDAQYIQERNFRNGILIGGIITLVIALFGLVGYTNDEVNRRRKEIAIRKVNGANIRDIQHLFLHNIMRIAVPTILIGDLLAWIIARQWLMSFNVKFPLSPWMFLAVTLLLLGIIALSVIVNSHNIARSNPVNYLKDE